jgi:dTDP-4-amino-4,6-dideoxygalactose transaminase
MKGIFPTLAVGIQHLPQMATTKPKRLFLSPPHLDGDELELVREAFASNYIAPIGPMVDAFEKEFAAYIGIPHRLALASGTAAIPFALRELGVGPGDKVRASTNTLIGSVSPVTFQGASLVFIVSGQASWNRPGHLSGEGCKLSQRSDRG